MPEQTTLTVRSPVPRLRERIVTTDWLLMGCNPEVFGVFDGRPRVVILACGHSALTKAHSWVTCPRCTEMLRRSIADGSEDYEAFRRGAKRDEMAWPADPCRLSNEPDVLSGRASRD